MDSLLRLHLRDTLTTMPYKDKAQQLEYQRKWIAQRRADFFEGKVCARCESTDRLELDHIDPEQKVSHNIWSWSQERREAELAKCQVLCYDCHKAKTVEAARTTEHGNKMYDKYGCRCDICKAAKSLRNARRSRISVPGGVTGNTSGSGPEESRFES